MITIGFMVGKSSYLPHAKVLVESIRKHGGWMSKAKILIMTPEFREMVFTVDGAEQVSYGMPESMRNLPFADKMYAASHFESLAPDSYLWMDVDSIVLKDPISLKIQEPLGIRPVDKKNIGLLAEQELDQFWKGLYQYFDLEENRDTENEGKPQNTVITTVSQEKIRSYYNVGLVLVQEKRALFQHTVEAMEELLLQPSMQNLLRQDMLHRIFFHQAVFSCMVQKLYNTKERNLLGRTVNFPMHFLKVHPDKLPFEAIETIRYDTLFENDAEADELLSSYTRGRSGQLRMEWYYESM